jgi:hypothetical protein
MLGVFICVKKELSLNMDSRYFYSLVKNYQKPNSHKPIVWFIGTLWHWPFFPCY